MGEGLTRKHFKRLAEAIASVPPSVERDTIARNIAAMCRSANPAFSSTKFFDYIEELDKRREQDAA